MRLNRRKRKFHGGKETSRAITKVALCSALIPLVLLMNVNTASAFNYTAALSYVKSKLLTSQQSDTFKVAVNQDSVGTAALAETSVIAKQVTATAEAQLLRKENFIDLYNDFIGPGAIPDASRCFAVNERQNDGQVPIKTQLYVKADIFNSMNQEAFNDEMERQQTLQNMKYSLTCTLEQAKQGYCTPTLSGGQYLDVDFGMSHASNRLMDTQFMATKSGIHTIANIQSDAKVNEECKGDSACLSNIAAENNRIAVNSLVANSLLSQLYNRMTVGTADDNQK